MRIFHEKVFDGLINAGGIGTAISSDFTMNELLGSADSLSFSGYTSPVPAGGSQSLTIWVYQAYNNSVFFQRSATVITPSTASEVNFQWVDWDAGTHSMLRYVKLVLWMQNTTGPCRVRIWATGRDYSRRAKVHNLSGGLAP